MSSTIDPQIEVFDDQGQSLLSVPFNFGFEGEGELLSLNSFSTSGFYFIKVTNAIDGNGSYQLRVKIPTAPQGSIMKGVVIDACSQNAIENASIVISTRFTRTYQGQFYISPVNPGSHVVTITADGYQDTSLTVEMSDLTVVNETIELTPQAGCTSQEPETAELTGQVIDQCTGDAIAGAMISSNQLSATTAANGEYLLQDLLLGNHSIVITAQGYRSSQLSVDFNQAGRRLNRNVRLIPQAGCPVPMTNNATITGLIIDQCTDQGIANVSIMTNGLTVKSTVSGEYILGALQSGRYTLIVSTNGYTAQQITVDLAIGQQLQRNLFLTPVNGCPDKTQISSANQYSGSWFDPSHNGEGFTIEVLAENQVFVTWYTYDANGNQAWIVGTGILSENTIDVSEAIITSGAIFGTDFNPTDVIRDVWGDFQIIFDDCHQATLTYNGPPEYGTGTQSLQRLTTISGLACSNSTQSEATPTLPAQLSGTWYDPSHDGEGFVIQMLNNKQAVIFWYTYDENGNQFWITGVGEIKDTQIIVDDAVFTEGGVFGAGFNPETVQRKIWGHITFDFSSCDSGVVNYDSTAKFGIGQLNLVRLTSVDGYYCESLP